MVGFDFGDGPKKKGATMACFEVLKDDFVQD